MQYAMLTWTNWGKKDGRDCRN